MSRFIKIFAAVIIVFLGYIAYSVEIFDAPKITFNASYMPKYNPIVSQRFNILCYQTQEQVSPIEKDELKILVWNIYKGKNETWKTELERFAQNADFLFLQEVSKAQNIPQLLQHSFPVSLYASSFSYLNQESGVNILSQTLPQQYCAGSEDEPWIKIPKIGVSSVYPLKDSDESLLVVNLHLVNFEWTPVSYQKQIVTLFQLVAQHYGPILLLGDFNSWNHKRFDLINDLAKKYQLKATTFAPDYRLRFFNNPLDHVFTRGFDIVEAKTINTDGSDHNPLLLTLKLKYSTIKP